MKSNKQYIGYDYKSVIVNRKFEMVWVDNYEYFGWELVQSCPAIVKPIWGPIRVMLAPLAILPGRFFKNLVMEHESTGQVELQFKRDKKLKNKNGLNRLQCSLENELNNVEQLELGKTFGASVAGYVMGCIGTVFMALATFCYLKSRIVLCIEFGASGFIGWIFAGIVYSVVKGKKEKKVVTEMEKKFDEIDRISMRAHELVTE